MGILHLNRCKNCRAWRPSISSTVGAWRDGTTPKHNKKCRMRLREEPAREEGEPPILRPTLDTGPDTQPGPKFDQATGPHDSCKHFVEKPRHYRTPKPREHVGKEYAAEDLAAALPPAVLVDADHL